LKSFLRQAGAIISAEKGLNSISRVKLQSLANRLKLPQSLFDEALDRLQSSPAAATDLSHYEKGFIKFLDSEFKKLAGDVLSLGMEKKAIDLANRKYEINNARAEQLIQAQSEAAGISRISPAEAALFAEQTIVDQIGDRTALDDDMQFKLHKIGEKWGLASADIDRLISRQLTNNRSQQSRGREKIAILMLAVAVVLGGLWGAYAMGMFTARGKNTIAPGPVSPTETSVVGNSWFTPSTLDQVKALSKSNAQLKSCFEGIQSVDALKRRQAYRQLVRGSCEFDSPDQPQINAVIGQLFFQEPENDSAWEITESIRTLLSPTPAGKTILRRKLESDYRANRLLGELFLSQPKTETVLESDLASRILALEECIRSEVGIPIDKDLSLEQYLAVSEEAIATDQWNRLIQSSWSSPGSAALVVESLYRLTQSKLGLETLEAYRDELLLSIMDTDESHWRELREPISQSLETCDEIRLAAWISVYSSAVDESLQDTLGPLLLKRIDIQPKSQRRKDVVAAIEEYGRQYRYRVLRPVINRNELINKHYVNMMDQDNSAPILPDRIAQMALAVNVELAFCAAIENVTHIDDSSFLEFDRLIAEPEPRLRELISLPIDRRGSKPTGPASATASDERRKSASLQRLSDLGPDSSGRRILALRQLERVAHRFERISYSDAKVLADYFLADLGVEELLENESRIESFSHWPNLALAIADKLPEKDIQIDRALTLTRLLLGREFKPNRNSDWKKDLGLDVLTAVAYDIENQIDLDPNNIKSNWIRLELYLNDNYRQRQAIVLNQGVAGNAYDTPFQATIDLVDRLARLSPRQSSNRSLEQATSLVRQSPLNEIEKAVFANQLLIQLLATDLADSEKSTDVPTILSALQDSFRKTDLPGGQLYATERTLFELMDLKRKSLVDQLLKRN